MLAVPGMTATTIATTPPFSPAGRRQLTSVDGRPVSDPPPDVMTVVVEPAYFHTVVRGLVLGESFSELHGTPGHEAAIVNQRFAEVHLGAGSPIGRHLELRPPTAQRSYLREAEDPASAGSRDDRRRGSRHSAGQGDAVPMVYLPFRAEAPAAGHADRARLRRTCPRRLSSPRCGERDRSRSRAWRGEDTGRDRAISRGRPAAGSGVAVREDRRPRARLLRSGPLLGDGVRREAADAGDCRQNGARRPGQHTCAGCS